MRPRHRLLLLIAALGWGLGGVVTRATFEQGADPIEVSAYRSVAGAITVGVYILLTRTEMPRDATTWRPGLVLGSTAVAAPFLLMTLAVVYASAGFVGLLIANFPIGTALWAHFLGDERLNRRKTIGLSISFAGVLILLISGDSGLGNDGNAALAIGLSCAGIAAGSYGILYAKRALVGIDSTQLALPQFAVGAVLLILLIPFTDGLPSDITAYGWLLIVAAGALTTAVPYLAFYETMKHISATQAALTGYLIPIIAIVLGALLLDEQITTMLFTGGAFILLGVVLADRSFAAEPSTR